MRNRLKVIPALLVNSCSSVATYRQLRPVSPLLNSYGTEYQGDADISNLLSPSGVSVYKARSILRTPLCNKRVLDSLNEAKVKLRGVLTWLRASQDFKTYGSSSRLLAVDGTYKKNLEDILREKKRKLSNPVTVVRKPRTIFHPDSMFKQVWNLVLLFLLLYVFTGTPWIIAFEEVEIGSPLFLFELSIDFLFFLDILITLNSAYFQNGILITNRKQIFLNYLKGLLVIDIIAIFPFYLFDQDESNARSNSLVRILRITKVARIFRASKIAKALEHLANSESMESIIRTIKQHDGITRFITVAYIIAIMAHFTACMWYFTAKFDGLGPDTWVVRHGYSDSPKGTLYLASLYWALTILTTVGFGDIHAFTNSEMIICTFWMIFGIGVYSFLIGTLTSVLTSMDNNSAGYTEIIREFDKLSEQFRINKKLRKKMKNEVTNQIALEANTSMAFLKKMPRSLQYETCMTMYDHAVSKVLFFQGQDIVFITNIVPKLRYQVFLAGKLIFVKNEHPEGIYFIVQGRVNFLIPERLLVFKTIIAGSYFGEYEIITKTTRSFSAITDIRSACLVMPDSLYHEISHNYTKVAKQIERDAEEKRETDVLAMTQILDYAEVTEIWKTYTPVQIEGKTPAEVKMNELSVDKDNAALRKHALSRSTTPQDPSEILDELLQIKGNLAKLSKIVDKFHVE